MSYPRYFKYQAFENTQRLKWTLQIPPRGLLIADGSWCFSSQCRPVADVVGEEEAKRRKGPSGTLLGCGQACSAYLHVAVHSEQNTQVVSETLPAYK